MDRSGHSATANPHYVMPMEAIYYSACSDALCCFVLFLFCSLLSSSFEPSCENSSLQLGPACEVTSHSNRCACSLLDGAVDEASPT
jgi:hypothetical protein